MNKKSITIITILLLFTVSMMSIADAAPTDNPGFYPSIEYFKEGDVFVDQYFTTETYELIALNDRISYNHNTEIRFDQKIWTLDMNGDGLYDDGFAWMSKNGTIIIFYGVDSDQMILLEQKLIEYPSMIGTLESQYTNIHVFYSPTETYVGIIYRKIVDDNLFLQTYLNDFSFGYEPAVVGSNTVWKLDRDYDGYYDDGFVWLSVNGTIMMVYGNEQTQLDRLDQKLIEYPSVLKGDAPHVQPAFYPIHVYYTPTDTYAGILYTNSTDANIVLTTLLTDLQFAGEPEQRYNKTVWALDMNSDGSFSDGFMWMSDSTIILIYGSEQLQLERLNQKLTEYPSVLRSDYCDATYPLECVDAIYHSDYPPQPFNSLHGYPGIFVILEATESGTLTFDTSGTKLSDSFDVSGACTPGINEGSAFNKETTSHRIQLYNPYSNANPIKSLLFMYDTFIQSYNREIGGKSSRSGSIGKWQFDKGDQIILEVQCSTPDTENSATFEFNFGYTPTGSTVSQPVTITGQKTKIAGSFEIKYGKGLVVGPYAIPAYD